MDWRRVSVINIMFKKNETILTLNIYLVYVNSSRNCIDLWNYKFRWFFFKLCKFRICIMSENIKKPQLYTKWPHLFVAIHLFIHLDAKVQVCFSTAFAKNKLFTFRLVARCTRGPPILQAMEEMLQQHKGSERSKVRSVSCT